jgi:uronate dehydrogenase
MTKKTKVLLIGATSKIALDFISDYFKEKYFKDYELTLGVRNKEKLEKLLPNNKLEIREINLSSPIVLEKAMLGIDIVLNLAANPSPQASFQELLEPNIVGTKNILESAKNSKIKKVIMASSIHAVKGQIPGLIKERDSPKPLTIYGATKAFTEALCNVYANNFNMTCIAIRIGAYVSNKDKLEICKQRTEYEYVISQRDMSQLLHLAIKTKFKENFTVLHGSSNNKIKRLDLEETKKLTGYKPQDDFYEVCRKPK